MRYTTTACDILACSVPKCNHGARARAHTHTHTHTHTYTHTHTHTHFHKHLHTHTHSHSHTAQLITADALVFPESDPSRLVAVARGTFAVNKLPDGSHISEWIQN
jgi:carbohydrate-binding DOMON domain-containing protein